MEKIGRFQVVKKLGQGAFGMVYKGHDPALKREAAIKVMTDATAGNAELVARFKREAEAAARLNHPSIVTIYDVGEQDNNPYIAMEFLEGKDLEQVIKKREQVSPEQKVDWVIQIAEGLHHAHTREIVHRDIKPANIRILNDGSIKIMDFGIAKMAASDMTRTGQFMGTINYMAPEQIKVQKLDGRCDLFALGVLFYELLTYRRPFPGDTITAVLYKIVNEQPLPMKELVNTPQAWLEGIVLKCLEKDPNHRFETCKALAEALRSKRKVAIPAVDLDQTMSEIQQLMNAGNFNEVLHQTSRLLVHNPENEPVRRQAQLAQAFQKADTLIESGRLGEARAALKDLMEDQPTPRVVDQVKRFEGKIARHQAEKLVRQAQTYLGESRFEPAIQAFQEALKLDPHLEEARGGLSQAEDGRRSADTSELLSAARQSFDSGLLPEARQKLEEALGIDPYNREAKALLQKVDFEQQRIKRRDMVTQVLNEARDAVQRGRIDEAGKLLQRLTPEDRALPETRSPFQEVEALLDKEGKAKTVLDLIGQGDKKLGAGRFDEARLLYQKALALDPEAIGAQRGLQAVKRRVTSKAALEKRRIPRPLWYVAAAIPVVAAAVLFIRGLPSDAAKLVHTGDRQAAKGEFAAAARSYQAARGAEGTPEEHAKAEQQYLALVTPALAGGDVQTARSVIDTAIGWGMRGAAPLLPALAQAFEARQEPLAAHQAYQSWFQQGWDPSKAEDLKKYFALGTSMLQSSPEDGSLADRIKLLEAAISIFEYAKTQDQSLPAPEGLVTARAALQDAVAIETRRKATETRLESLLEQANASFKEQLWSEARDRLLDADDAIQKNADLDGYVKFSRFETRIETLRQGITKAEEGAEGERRRKEYEALLGDARALAAGEDKKKAVDKFREVAAAFKAPRDLRRDAVTAAGALGAALQDEMAKADVAEAQRLFAKGDMDSLRSAESILQAVRRDHSSYAAAGPLLQRVTQARDRLVISQLRKAADASLQKGEIAAAKANIQKILALDDKDADANRKMAQIRELEVYVQKVNQVKEALDSHHFVAAAEGAREILAEKPAHPEASQLLTQAIKAMESQILSYLRASDYTQADFWAQQLLDIEPDSRLALDARDEIHIIDRTKRMWSVELEAGSRHGTEQTRELFEEIKLQAVSPEGQRIQRWAYGRPPFEEDKKLVLDKLAARGCAAAAVQLDLLFRQRPTDPDLMAATRRCEAEKKP